MQTVTLEFKTADLETLGLVPAGFFARYEEIELLETLVLEPGFRLQLVRLRSRGPLKGALELERESRRIRRAYGLEEFEVVERSPRTRDYLLLVRQRNPDQLQTLLELAGSEVRPTAPFRINAERVIATFHGPDRPVRKILNRLTRDGFPYRIIRATAKPYVPDVGTAELTPAQLEVIARAWALGFYAVPRRITLTRLARLTGRSPPALGKMLRRAEGHLVARLLATSRGALALASGSPMA